MSTRTLAGAFIARQLIDDLAGGERCAHARDGDISASARRTDEGTLVVDVRSTRTWAYASPVGSHIKRYVRARDEVAAVNRIVSKVVLAANAPEHHAREALCVAAEAREVPESWFDEATMPHPSIAKTFDRMTLDDVAALLPLVLALPLKKENAA